MLPLLLATAILLVLSALISGSEAALFSLPAGKVPARLKGLLDRPERLLGTLLLGNLLTNTSATALFTLFLLRFARSRGFSETGSLSIGGLAMTALIVLFGELAPKIAGRRSPERFARRSAPLLALLGQALSPLTLPLSKLRFLAHLPQEPATLTDEELHTLIELGQKRGVLLPGEEEILRNLIDLERRTVSEVMTPRGEIVAIPEETTVRQALEMCRESGYSRLPVYSKDLEEITGIVYAKDLLTVAAAGTGDTAGTLARPAHFVPAVKHLLPLLDELRRKSSHIAIVVDEFGQTAGLVTLEDILEAIFGEIADEFDTAEEPPYRKLAEDLYRVDGAIDLATLNHLFDNAFRPYPHERLSALIYDRLGRLPRPGDTLRLGDLELSIEELDEHKIKKVLIRRRRG